MDTFTEIKYMVLLLQKEASNFSRQVDSRLLKSEHELVMNHTERTYIHTRRSRGSCVNNTDSAVSQLWNLTCPVNSVSTLFYAIMHNVIHSFFLLVSRREHCPILL